MRIAQVTWRLGFGGLERLVRNLATRQNSCHDGIIICLRDEGEWGLELQASGFPIFALNRREGVDLAVVMRLQRILVQQKIDVVHLHGYSCFFYGAMAARRAGTPCIYTEHATSYQKVSRKRRLANHLLQHIPLQMTACSENVREFLIHEEGIRNKTIEIVRNGLPEPKRIPRDQARTELGIAQDAFVALSAGRLDPVKGFSALAQAAQAMNRDVVVLIAGEGPDRPEIQRAIGTDHRVRLLGYRSDTNRLYSAADAYVNTSTNEAASLGIIQAMSHGLPVIATEAGGNPELVLANNTGFLVEPNCPSDLVDAVEFLRANPMRKREMGQRGRQKFCKELTEEKMFREYDLRYLLAAASRKRMEEVA